MEGFWDAALCFSLSHIDSSSGGSSSKQQSERGAVKLLTKTTQKRDSGDRRQKERYNYIFPSALLSSRGGKAKRGEETLQVGAGLGQHDNKP